MIQELKSKRIGDFELRFFKGEYGIVRTQIRYYGAGKPRGVCRLISSFDSENKDIALKKSRKIIDEYIDEQIEREKTESLIQTAQSSGMA
tara:strand:+ start:3634 stop:3903 length:270 start_codon:yes stop_codon:yes gene_type:complete